MEFNRRQSQFELFPATSENLTLAEKKGYRFKDLTLSLENIIVISIILVMVLVLSFSFGVENGKNFYRVRELKSQTSQDLAQSDREIPSKSKVAFQPVKNASLSAGSVDKLTVQSLKPARLNSDKLPGTSEKFKAINVQKEMAEPSPATPKRNLQEELIGRYTIQVASFKKKERAVEEAQKLTKKGHQIFIVPKGSHSIVCIGKFSQKKEAEKVLNKFKNKYGDSLVRRF